MIDYPPTPPVVIVIGGRVLTGWTAMNLSRQKKDMTGQLSVSLWFEDVPKKPVVPEAAAGKEVMVYIGGLLAFTGTLDKREGSGKDSKKKKSGKIGNRFGSGVAKSIGSGRHTKAPEGISSHIGPDQYVVTLSARGKTKNMMTASHQHKTGQINKAKTRGVITELLKPFRIPLEWRAAIMDMDKARFRDGAAVIDEIDRVCNEYGYARYETRQGKLRVTDKAGPERGDPLILGENIMEFEASQSEDAQNSPVTVKGQRTKKNVRGRAAINRSKTIGAKGAGNANPITVQMYGDATDKALARRARHEINTRNAESRQLTITVHHVMPLTGAAWDLGMIHYVEVPPEAIFGDFECTGIQYTVNHDKTFKTTLQLNPLPATDDGAGMAGGLVQAARGAMSGDVIGAARMAAAGIKLVAGQYPASWAAPSLIEMPTDPITGLVKFVGEGVQQIESGLREVAQALPPLELPALFRGG